MCVVIANRKNPEKQLNYKINVYSSVKVVRTQQKDFHSQGEFGNLSRYVDSSCTGFCLKVIGPRQVLCDSLVFSTQIPIYRILVGQVKTSVLEILGPRKFIATEIEEQDSVPISELYCEAGIGLWVHYRRQNIKNGT